MITWTEFRAQFLANERARDERLRAGLGIDGYGPVGWRYVGPPMVPTSDHDIRRMWLSHIAVWRQALEYTWRAGFYPQRLTMSAAQAETWVHAAPLALDAADVARRLGIKVAP